MLILRIHGWKNSERSKDHCSILKFWNLSRNDVAWHGSIEQWYDCTIHRNFVGNADGDPKSNESGDVYQEWDSRIMKMLEPGMIARLPSVRVKKDPTEP
jgi:hypothetical protein